MAAASVHLRYLSITMHLAGAHSRPAEGCAMKGAWQVTHPLHPTTLNFKEWNDIPCSCQNIAILLTAASRIGRPSMASAGEESDGSSTARQTDVAVHRHHAHQGGQSGQRLPHHACQNHCGRDRGCKPGHPTGKKQLTHPCPVTGIQALVLQPHAHSLTRTRVSPRGECRPLLSDLCPLLVWLMAMPLDLNSCSIFRYSVPFASGQPFCKTDKL